MKDTELGFTSASPIYKFEMGIKIPVLYVNICCWRRVNDKLRSSKMVDSW